MERDALCTSRQKSSHFSTFRFLASILFSRLIARPRCRRRYIARIGKEVPNAHFGFRPFSALVSYTRTRTLLGLPSNEHDHLFTRLSSYPLLPPRLTSGSVSLAEENRRSFWEEKMERETSKGDRC